MLKVAGIPFTEHQIIKAREAGVKEIVLATSYLAEVFKPYFGDGEKFGIKILYAEEEKALGTGGAIRNAATKLTGDGPVFIFNGDVLSSHNLRNQMEFHLKNNADVSLYLTEVPDARAFGAVELSGDFITTFNEKMENPPTNIINAGCYIFNRDIIFGSPAHLIEQSFNGIPANSVVSVEREVFPRLLENHYRLCGFVDRSYWLDIGTPAALLKATRDLISGVASSDAFDHLLSSGRFQTRDGSLVAVDAEISRDCLIQAGSFVDHGAVLGAGVHISGSVIGAGAVIGDRSTLKECFVAPKADIPVATYGLSAFFGWEASTSG